MKNRAFINNYFFVLTGLYLFLIGVTDQYIFVTDMVFVPDMPLPQDVTSIYLFEFILFILSKIMPAWVVQRLLLLAIFVTIFISAQELIKFVICNSEFSKRSPKGSASKNSHSNGSLKLNTFYFLISTQPMSFVPIFAGALYLLNNFVYTRFMVGQWAVLMGYALLPLILLATLKLLRNPAPRKSWLTLGGLLALMGILSIHYLGIALIMTLIVFLIWALDARATKGAVKPAAKSLIFSLLSFIFLSSYWLLPLLLGKSKTSETISSFGVDDLTAYATTGDGIGIFGNLLRLQGFWADNANLYLLPRDTHWWWWIPLVVLLYLVIKGVFWSYKKQRLYFKIFASLLMVGLVIGAGTKAPLVGWFNQLLVDHVPLFGGYREPQKFVGLIALSYAYFASCGLLAFTQSNKSVISNQLSVVSNTRLRKTDNEKQKTSGSALSPNSSFRFSKIGYLILLLPILLVPDLWFNAGGQLKTGDYPAGWYSAKVEIKKDYDGNGKVLYLPWRLYMPYSFSGGVIANPAPKFFGLPSVSSQNPELGPIDASTETAPLQFENTRLVNAEANQNLANDLLIDSIEYVVLVKEYNYKKYQYVADKPGFNVLYDDKSITVYKLSKAQ